MCISVSDEEGSFLVIYPSESDPFLEVKFQGHLDFGIWDLFCKLGHINRDMFFYISWAQLGRDQVHITITTPVQFIYSWRQ